MVGTVPNVSEYDPTDFADTEAKHQRHALKAKLESDKETSDLRWLMSGKRGRTIVHRMLSQAGVFQSVFNTNSMQMAFNEGGRNVGLRLLSQVMSACPEKYALMLKEQHDDRNADDGHNDH